MRTAIPSHPPSAFLAALACMLVLGPPSLALAAAQATPSTFFVLPIDIGQGAVTGVNGQTPYTASLKLHPALGLGTGGPIRVGPVAGVRFANPDWTLAGGLRAQWLPLRFGLGGGRWGAGLAVEQLWDTGAGRPGALGLIGDLELIRLSAG
jgi:hypothetical protein